MQEQPLPAISEVRHGHKQPPAGDVGARLCLRDDFGFEPLKLADRTTRIEEWPGMDLRAAGLASITGRNLSVNLVAI